MTETAGDWLLRSAAGGGLLLLIAWVLMRGLRHPARQQRLGEWAAVTALLLAGLCLFPAWLHVPVPGWTKQVAGQEEPPPAEEMAGDDLVFLLPPAMEEDAPRPDVPPHPPAVELEAAAASSPVAASWWEGWRLVDVFLLGYAGISALLLLRWLAANAAVRWLLRASEPAPAWVRELFEELAGGTKARLVVSPRVRVPFSVGLVRQTVALPAVLVAQATPEEMRWVLVHELTHLKRQDTRVSWLFALAEMVYFYLPWFWWLRRRVRLCQEYVADAAAAEWAAQPADYAQFLVNWAGRPVAGSAGISGSGSDLYRRVKKMLRTSTHTVERETPRSRGWLLGLGAGLLSLAVLAGGVGVRAWADEKPADPAKPKTEPDKEEAKKEEAKKEQKRRADPFALLREFQGQGFGEDAEKELQRRMDELQKRVDEMMKAMQPGQFPRLPGMRGEFAFPGDDLFGRAPARPQVGRLGAQVRSPSQTLVNQLDLPKNQGQVLEEVGPNSAAAKAGLKKHDILLEVDGKTVPSKPDEFRKLLKDVKANAPVDVVVMRKGKKETVKGLTLPEVKEAKAEARRLPGVDGFPNFPAFPNLGGQLLENLAGGATSIQRTNDEFTATHRSRGVKLTVKGKVEQGKAEVFSVTVEDAQGQKTTYESVEKVPAEHRERVRKLAEMSAKGAVRFPVD